MTNHLFVMNLSLVALDEETIPFSGSGLRSSIVRAVSHTDPFLNRSIRAGRLHLYVTSLLSGGRLEYKCGSQDLNVTRGSSYRVKITADSERVPSALKVWMLRNQRLTMHNIPFELGELRVKQVDLNSIEKEPHRSLRIRFLSPTCFHEAQSPYCAIFPEARKIIGPLASSWVNITSRSDVDPKEIRKWAHFSMAETAYELCTSKPLELPDGRKAVGFLGWTNYKHLFHPEWSEDVHEDLLGRFWMLLRFGEHIGVGLGNTMGLGLIRCEAR